MQMFKRLLLIVALVVLVSGCAQPPTEDVEDARSVVAHAYAAGAAQYAPGEYQLASSALQAAERQLKNKEYRRASRTLDLARRYSAEALKLTIARKQQQAVEQKKIEEQQQAELARLREIKRQAELKEQQERKNKQVVKPEKPTPVTPVNVEKAPPAPVEPELVANVEVQPGENLAMIAARTEVYNDALLWPLIYKANRDQIKDPKEIFSGQMLMIPRDKNREEAEAARKEARELNLF